MSASIVGALQDGLQLFNLLASDYVPRTHKQIVELAAASGYDWSHTKIHNMLSTLAAERFVRQGNSGEWSIAPHITAIATTYQESIIRRSQAILDEVAEIKSTTQERMQ